MPAQNDLFLFARRDFLKFASAAGMFPFAGLLGGMETMPENPLATVREKRFSTLVAIVRAQIDALWCGHQGDDACQVAREILVYAEHLPNRLQQGINIALLWLDIYSLKHRLRHLSDLPPRQLRELLNQGEVPVSHSNTAPILWTEDHLLHTAVSGLAMLGRMVIHSRPAARDLVGLSWSKECEDPKHLVTVAAPTQADLNDHYDVCIIGSGAGGATMASRLTAEGLKVLIVEVGDFVSPDALVQRVPMPDGTVRLAPPRSDEVSYRLYKDAGGQIAGGLGNVDSKLQLAIPAMRKKIAPKQTINVCQAKVLGGGPYVNNAIHLPISQDAYASWGQRQPKGVTYEQLAEIMNSINAELGVNTRVTEMQISDRSLRFQQGCEAIGETVHALPVAMRQDCLGCGSDNSVDSFGDHIGGLHPYSEGGPNSFLVSALHNPEPARVSYRTTAQRLRISRDESNRLRVDGLDVCRAEESNRSINATVSADQYVVAAGVGATTQLLHHSLSSAGLSNHDLGKRLSANVGTAIYAMFDKPIWPSDSGRPEPGVTQCFLIDRRHIEENGITVEEPALENWFHFPGTVALALCGWFQEFACVMRKFNHLSMAGIVVPTEVRASNYVDGCGKFHLELDCAEFELLLRGMRRIARIYFAAATPDDGVTLHLPTKAVLLRYGKPAVIRTMEDFEWALSEIRRRGPAFVNLLTTHVQGGAAFGDVTDVETFAMKTSTGEQIENLTIADASVFPSGCQINPQLTVKALSTIAAHHVINKCRDR